MRLFHGPGNYDIKNPLFKILKNVKFGKELRTDPGFEFSKKIPGPGSYDFKKMTLQSPRYKFSHSPRNCVELKNKFPGPGTYEYKQIIGKDGPSTSIHLKQSSDLNDKYRTPSPDTYFSQKSPLRKNKIGYIFAKAPKNLNKEKKVPGPGSYEPKRNLIFKAPPSPSFGKLPNENSKLKISVPGPGKYENPLIKKKPPNYSFGKSIRDIKQLSQAPGPGVYEYERTISNIPTYFHVQPKFKFNKIKS